MPARAARPGPARLQYHRRPEGDAGLQVAAARHPDAEGHRFFTVAVAELKAGSRGPAAAGILLNLRHLDLCASKN